MPIYEYQCSRCGHQLEAFQNMSEPPLTECPNCHQQALNKLVSAGGFQLKGTGWYKTDYSVKGKAKPTTETENKSDSGGTEKKAPDTDTKAKDSSSDKSKSSSTSSSSSSSGAES